MLVVFIECFVNPSVPLTGYYVDIEELPAWKRILFIYALFMMMLMFLLGAINNAWKCYKKAGKGKLTSDAAGSSLEEKKSLLGGDKGYSSIQYEEEPILAKKMKQYAVDI